MCVCVCVYVCVCVCVIVTFGWDSESSFLGVCSGVCTSSVGDESVTGKFGSMAGALLGFCWRCHGKDESRKVVPVPKWDWFFA